MLAAVVVAALSWHSPGVTPSTTDLLCDAARRGNVEQFTKLLEEGQKKRALGDDFLSRKDNYAPDVVAGCAAEAGRAALLELVIDDVDAAARSSILDAAACAESDAGIRSSAIEVEGVLAKHGVVPTSANVDGALCLAERGDTSGLARFLDGGVSASRVLRVAKVDTARWLLDERKADVNAPFPCVDEARAGGPFQTCPELLALDIVLPPRFVPSDPDRQRKLGKRTLDVDDQDWTVLHLAALRGDLAVVELLIAHDANVNAPTARGFAPIHLATWAGHRDVVERLLTAGADKNKLAGGKLGLVHLAVLSVVAAPTGTEPSAPDEAIAFIKWLKERGVAVDKRNLAQLGAQTSASLASAAKDASTVDAERIKARMAALERVKGAL